MKETEHETLEWITSQQASMVAMLKEWSECNSGSFNISGLASMRKLLEKAFSPLDCHVDYQDAAPLTTINDNGEQKLQEIGGIFTFTKRPEAAIRVLLCGHYDTVFGVDSPFQKTRDQENGTINGPGVTDMKGGLIIMLTALKALERSPYAEKIGWQVIISGDEEIGSPGSCEYLVEKARDADIGLIFGPCLPDGSWICERMGSANFSIVARGRSAHVGREFSQGRNALVALAKVADTIASWTDLDNGFLVNVGKISGGGPVNVVPSLGVMKFNIRAKAEHQMNGAIDKLEHLVKEHSETEGIDLELHTHYTRPPKPFDAKTQQLFTSFAECAKELNIDARWTSSGGVCDGNLFASAGLPTIDTLGAHGGKIHTEEEYIHPEAFLKEHALLLFFIKASKR